MVLHLSPTGEPSDFQLGIEYALKLQEELRRRGLGGTPEQVVGILEEIEQIPDILLFFLWMLSKALLRKITKK